MGQTRFLRWEDKLRVSHLLKQNKKIVEKKFDVDTNFYHRASLDSFLLPTKPRFLIGSFNSDDELSACVGIHLWHDLPCCTICFLMISPRYRQHFRPKESGYIACIEAAYSHCEKNGINQFYYFQRKRPTKKGRDIWASNATPFLKKYISYQVATVPANTCPIWRSYWDVMEGRTWPFESEIRRISLKPEYFDDLQYNELK